MPNICRPRLSDLIDVVRPTRPVASVYLGPTTACPWRPRWIQLADQLCSDGASQDVVDTIGAALRSARSADSEQGSLVGFAGDELPPRVFSTPGLRHLDLAWFSAPAHVLPLLAWVQERPSCVVVAAGHDDAELGVGSARRVHLRYPGQAWREGIRSAAAASVAMLEMEEARLLVVAGEDAVVGALWEALPEPVRRDVTVRWIGTDLSPSRVEAEVRAAAQSWIEDALADFNERGRSRRLGVEGVDDTLAALAGGRIDDLFVGHPEDVTATAWYGLEPTDVAPGRVAGARRRCGLLADVVVRAALLSGTRVHVINAGTPGALEAGIGGLCRVPLTLVRS